MPPSRVGRNHPPSLPHIRVYLSNLYGSQRYLGKSDLAADYAKELGQAWEATKEAAQLWRKTLDGEVESDVRTRILLSLAPLEEDAEKRRQMFQEAVELNGNLIAAAGAALSLRFGAESMG